MNCEYNRTDVHLMFDGTLGMLFFFCISSFQLPASPPPPKKKNTLSISRPLQMVISGLIINDSKYRENGGKHCEKWRDRLL